MGLEFLIGVGVLCGLTAALSLLMLLAEALIARYGPCTITINARRTLTVEGGRSLLATLKDADIFIPSACGGRGSCGLCKVTLERGAGSPLATELAWLSPAEQAGGVRLACQVKVKNDLALVLPEALLEVRQYATRVVGLRDLTPDIKEVRLQLVDPPAITFKAGQFIQFEVPPYDLTDEPVYRAYSIASPPSASGAIELEIRAVPNGLCTTYVHRHLRVGDVVTINGPYGDFTLRDTDREILCVAGGSGMAPIKSILTDMAEQRNPRKVRYFYGARARADLAAYDAIRALESALPDFSFIPALSAPGPDDGWRGETGRITDVMDRHVEKAPEAEAYLCGSPFLIDACIQRLTAKGLPMERIYYDKFA